MARLILVVLILAAVLALLFYQWHQSNVKGKRDVNDYISCLNHGGDNTSCTQLGK